MKDLISAFLAISVLSVGVLGMYMYSNKEDNNSDDETFQENNYSPEILNEQDDIYEETPKSHKQKGKTITKKNKKMNNSKRRY
jgi:hypothetical protein